MSQEAPIPAGTASFSARFFAEEIRAWQGSARLARVFWFHGVLGGSMLAILLGTTIAAGQRVAEQGLLFLAGAYTTWLLVSIWRCAEASASAWGDLARFLTIAWGVNVALVLGFLQIDILISCCMAG